MKKLLSIFFLLFLFSWHLSAQDEIEEGSIVDTITVNADLFEGMEPIDLTMKFDIKAFQKNKHKGEYMPAELTYHLNDTQDIIKTVRLKARGNFRRSHCSLPPFWLNIRKSDIKNESLQGTKKMKVVTHCNGGKSSSEYVLKEFLAYKIYNILSPYSFRVRLVRMKYIDTGRKDKEKESWAFMIEPEEMLTERLEAITIKNDMLSMHHMDHEWLDRSTMFLYMIGNSDYSITGRHNMKIIGFMEVTSQVLIPVPYDFDYSGIVNAFYAVPGEALGIKSVTERYFLGACREANEYQSTIDYFNMHKEEILELIKSFPYLDDKQKAGIISYIEEFYVESSMPQFIQKKIKSTCR